MMKNRFIFLTFGLFMTANLAYAEGFVMTSPDIAGQLSHNQVLSGFGCAGKNVSPKLSWDNAPKGTQSFAVTVYDPDTPMDGGWWHWVIFDIPSQVKSLESNAGDVKSKIAPKGSSQSMTSFGSKGFGGACPPKGSKPHQYIFTVHALKVAKLDLDTDATPGLVGFYIHQNVLAKASLVAYYSR